MWVVFLLSAIVIAIATLLVIYVGNKVINAMKRDDYKLDKDINKENNTSEKENKSMSKKRLVIGVVAAVAVVGGTFTVKSVDRIGTGKMGGSVFC